MPDPTQLTFRALADPTRRDILKLLSDQDMTIGDVAGRFDMTRAAVKKHLTMLSDGGLITVQARGREKINRINPQGFAPILSWFEHFDSFWDARLDALKTAIENGNIMTNTTIRKSIFLKASRETVWDFLTQPDKLKIWFHAPKTPLKEGEDFTLYGAESGNRAIWGEVRRATAPEYLEYTFTVNAMDGATSTVKWTLDEVPGGTRLSLEHQDLPEGEAAIGLMFALDKGWDEHMGQMRDHLNKDAK